MMDIAIGYQGTPGSNSETAAITMASSLFRNGTHDAAITYVPLVSSSRVISSLAKGELDYGVCATRNDIGGTVREMRDALANHADIIICPIMTMTLGCLGRDVAVLCPRRAGERYGLQLMRANMKDKPSHTTFCMYAATNEND